MGRHPVWPRTRISLFEHLDAWWWSIESWWFDFCILASWWLPWRARKYRDKEILALHDKICRLKELVYELASNTGHLISVHDGTYVLKKKPIVRKK